MSYAPCSSRRPSRSPVFARDVQMRARGGTGLSAGRSLTVMDLWRPVPGTVSARARASRVRLHVMGRSCTMHVHLGHGGRTVGTGDRLSPSVIVSAVVSSHCLARVSARYARAQPMRRDTETITGRHARTARYPAALTRAREPAGSAGQTIVRDATGGRRSKLDITRPACMSCACSIRVRHTAF